MSVYLHWRFLVARVYKAQSVPDHSHFDLFVHWTRNILKNSWCHLEQTQTHITAQWIIMITIVRYCWSWHSLTSCSCSILILGLEFTSSSTGLRFFISRMSKPNIWDTNTSYRKHIGNVIQSYYLQHLGYSCEANLILQIVRNCPVCFIYKIGTYPCFIFYIPFLFFTFLHICIMKSHAALATQKTLKRLY